MRMLVAGKSTFFSVPRPAHKGLLFLNWQLGNKQSAEKLASTELMPRIVSP